MLNKNINTIINYTGIVVGLVAITPGCGYVKTWASLVIGAISTVICYTVGFFMKELTHIDDTLDVFAVHGKENCDLFNNGSIQRGEIMHDI